MLAFRKVDIDKYDVMTVLNRPVVNENHNSLKKLQNKVQVFSP